MTDTATRPEESTPDTESAPRPRRRWNRRRLLAPLAVAALLIGFTVVAALVEAPSPGSEDFLSPNSAEDEGAAELSAELAAAGVTVQRYTDPTEAFGAAANGRTTVFVPAPDYLNGDEWSRFQQLRGLPDVRTVLVDPSPDYLVSVGLRQDGSRIATGTVAPDEDVACGLPEADRAGPAAVLRQRYREQPGIGGEAGSQSWRLCYDGGLAASSAGDGREVVVGAPDVFDNEHLDLAGNRALALGLLGSRPTLVWLDHHSLNPMPEPSDPPTVQPTGDHSRQPIEYPQARSTSPIYGAFPGWSWALLVGLLLLGVLVALWRGRRMGPPVTEALPATVPSAETVYGRARLYRRARAWPQAARAIRSGARQRIAEALTIPSRTPDPEFAAAVATHTGQPVEQVARLLFGPDPTREIELMTIVDGLDVLLSIVESTRPQGRQ